MSGLRWVRLEGGSMRPFLKAGQSVAVREVRPENLRAGDIVLYRVEEALRIHRLAFRRGGRFWLFDDAAEVGWHPVDAVDLLGRVELDSLLAGGWTGLLYGLAASAFRRFCRPLLSFS